MDLHSLLSGEKKVNFSPAKNSQIEDISSKQSSVAFDHDQLLEQIGLNASKQDDSPILQINIQMKEGLEVINVYQGDDPKEVATKFVAKYPEIMSEQAVDILTL